MKNGQAFKVYLDEIRQTIALAKESPETASYAGKLENALKKIEKITLHLISVAQTKGPEAYLADATLYLELFGIVTVAWQWLKQATAASNACSRTKSNKEKNFYQGKLFAFKYFFEYELPKIVGRAQRLMSEDFLTVEMKPEHFMD